MSDVEVIIAKNVTWPKTDKLDRTKDQEFMKKLALSIKTDGLLQPIGVRPDPAKPGHYIGVFGRHRTDAVITQLKLDMIQATVFVDMDEKEAEIATRVENLFRNPLSKTQQARSIALWHEHYDLKRKEYDAAKKLAEANEPKPAARTKKPKKGAEGQSGPEKPEATPIPETVAEPTATDSPIEPAAPLPVAPPTNFAKHVAAVTGQSETTIKRALKIGKAFTPAQFEIIEQCGVNQTWQDTIAEFPEAKRAAVLNLIASGMDETAAIAQIDGTPEVTRADGRSYEVTPTEGAEKSESDMTDEEWARFHCSETISLLEDPSHFLSHALLYRTLRDLRQSFKSKSKTAMAEAKKHGVYGGLYAVINRFLTVSHPSKWLRCGACKGAGFVQTGDKQSKCKECQANGFVVKFEGK